MTNHTLGLSVRRVQSTRPAEDGVACRAAGGWYGLILGLAVLDPLCGCGGLFCSQLLLQVGLVFSPLSAGRCSELNFFLQIGCLPFKHFAGGGRLWLGLMVGRLLEGPGFRSLI